MKPDFLVIGAQKCATSTLCDLLAMQTDIFMCNPKEPHFFSKDEVWERGLHWYEALFAGAEKNQRVGEGSTTYSMRGRYPLAAARIVETLPDVKLIYIVRNPLQRIESHWLHRRIPDGMPERRPFAEVVRMAPEMIDNTLYRHQLERYRELIGDQRILVLFYEDLIRDQRTVLVNCLRFLGLAESALVMPATEVRNNAASAKRPDNSLGLLLRRLPGIMKLRSLMPSWFLRRVRKFLKAPVDNRPEWDAPLRAWVLARIADDNRQFLRENGKPEDFWGIDWGVGKGIDKDERK